MGILPGAKELKEKIMRSFEKSAALLEAATACLASGVKSMPI